MAALSGATTLLASGRSNLIMGSTGCLFSVSGIFNRNVSARCSAASRRGNLWTAAQRSSTLPPTPQLGEKHRKTFLSVFTENERL